MLINMNRTLKMMEKYNLDALISTTPENIYYISDYRPLHRAYQAMRGVLTFAVLPREKEIEPAFVTSISDVAWMDLLFLKLSWIHEINPYGAHSLECPFETELNKQEVRMKKVLRKPAPREAIEALVETLKMKGLDKGRIGLDEMGVTHSVFEKIVNRLPNTDIVKAYEIFREVRMVKTREEIGRIKRSATIAEEAMMSMMNVADLGITWKELSDHFRESVVAKGGIPVFWTIGMSSISYLSTMPPTFKLDKGDLIRLDLGCIYDGYYSDTARTAVLGNPTQKQETYYKAILEGQQKALEAIKPGVGAHLLYDIAIKNVKKEGIPHYSRHHCGHGIGVEIYEPPMIRPKNTTRLEEGMVMCVETPYYELGFGGLQIEDTIVVTHDGFEYLTENDRELYIL